MAGLRERKKALTRTALRQAALELCRRHGPAEVTVEAISARAGVSVRTFFNYFPSKDAAIGGWSDEDTTMLREQVVGRPAEEDPLTAVAVALADLVDLTTASPLWHAQLELMRQHPEMLGQGTAASRRMETAIAEAVSLRTGCGAGTPEVLILAAASTAALRVALVRWLDSPEGTDARDLLADAIEMLRGGLGRVRWG